MAMKKLTYRQRAEACLEAFNRVLRNSDIPVAQAFELAAALPAPRFYCTYEHARKMVAAIERGAPLPVLGEIPENAQDRICYAVEKIEEALESLGVRINNYTIKG